MSDVPIVPLQLERFDQVLTAGRREEFENDLEQGRRRLGDRTFWHVNSTADGGGVAEMLHTLLGYLVGAGIRTKWHVIAGDDAFFTMTKRIHNRLHGDPGDGGELGPAERDVYDRTLRLAARRLVPCVRPGDVVVLHDPQTAGLAPALKSAGAQVIWCCHVGVDEPNELARSAWQFLRDDVEAADAHVFSRSSYAWDGLTPDKLAVIPPCIDTFSAKNQYLVGRTTRAILQTVGALPGTAVAQPRFFRQDGSSALVRRPVEIMGGPLNPAAPVVLQVSRWDRLKDPLGVMRGFLEHVRPFGAQLVLAGPAADSVTDDPEGADVLRELRRAYARLPAEQAALVFPVCLPMEDLEENAAIVNALQRYAAVITQKSLAEGFGLTVAEGMWKQRPVVGPRVGGIQDQIRHEETGLLIDDPADLRDWGAAVSRLLADPEKAVHLGAAARETVAARYLPPSHLGGYLRLLQELVP